MARSLIPCQQRSGLSQHRPRGSVDWLLNRKQSFPSSGFRKPIANLRRRRCQIHGEVRNISLDAEEDGLMLLSLNPQFGETFAGEEQRSDGMIYRVEERIR